MNKQPRNPTKDLTQAELRVFFISHLNRIYCAKKQLIEKLPQLGRRSYFLDLQQAINETIDVVSLQIGRMKEIYIALDAFYQPESCVGVVGILDEAFQCIGMSDESPALRDLSILFYMQNIESIEMASFKTMMRVADRLEQPGITQLLTECYDEAREDKVLFREITENYL
ncbi:DUF892 family protein [Mucilaginibacter sp. UR6-11]|uniref:DUF892 family protein n=1 Tax=Mucilaginibacter sp. UR6-11 TaxID=1435644 RepID=UPI001E443777|nr:DUF892 family protein [Mucilaginibacter sp. UR6-11]MCC8424726.1 DUF892 family protein [Mucilaginibacter sp. UR6-11]